MIFNNLIKKQYKNFLSNLTLMSFFKTINTMTICFLKLSSACDSQPTDLKEKENSSTGISIPIPEEKREDDHLLLF